MGGNLRPNMWIKAGGTVHFEYYVNIYLKGNREIAELLETREIRQKL